MAVIDFSQCAICCYEESQLNNYYGSAWCDKCVEMDKTTDWDAFEENKRAQIVEQNEY